MTTGSNRCKVDFRLKAAGHSFASERLLLRRADSGDFPAEAILDLKTQ